MTQKEQIVETTKKAFTIATDLIQQNLEGLGNDKRLTPSSDSQNELAIIRIEGLVDFLKNELALYKSNMDHADKIESFINQLKKDE